MAKPKKPRMPRIKKEWKRFSQALKKGRLPDNATTRRLRQFFGAKGAPLAHKLRTRAAREEFNALLLKYNRERMTVASDMRKKIDIRKKQMETRARNVKKSKAKAAQRKYAKVLYILEAVADDIGAYITYQEAEQLVTDNQGMSPKKITEFIKNRYAAMQDANPDFAKEPETTLNKAFGDLEKLMETFNTTSIEDIQQLISDRDSNPQKFQKRIKAREEINKLIQLGKLKEAKKKEGEYKKKYGAL